MKNYEKKNVLHLKMFCVLEKINGKLGIKYIIKNRNRKLFLLNSFLTTFLN